MDNKNKRYYIQGAHTTFSKVFWCKITKSHTRKASFFKNHKNTNKQLEKLYSMLTCEELKF